jgi:hypothetical protein
MQFTDFSPPSSPSLEQQRDALQKGLGRAVQWALAGRLDDGPLLEACLRDQRYDHQFEECRADWLWRIVTTLGAAGRFRAPILHALSELADDWSTEQLCGFARHYAETGDETFRCRLYELVEQKPFSRCEWLGEEDILELDGEQGFLFAARARGKLLANREWQCEDGCLIDAATERFGEERIRSVLADASDEHVRRFQQAWSRSRQPAPDGNPRAAHQARARAITVPEILATAEQPHNFFGPFRRWGTFADEDGLRAVLRHLWSERNPVVIANLLKIFSGRPLPEFDPRMIDFCVHEDESVRKWACAALKRTRHPLVAEFARAQVEQGLPDRMVLKLFVNNYEAGDERRILQVLELPDVNWERHGLLMDVITMLEAHPQADCSQLAIIAYASTPCENCRRDAAGLLHDRQAAPHWLTAECQFDSSEECRSMITQRAAM